ncbi:MAG: hypothetical protein ACO1QB_09265 [Verrucomicrobiales bacterium]
MEIALMPCWAAGGTVDKPYSFDPQATTVPWANAADGILMVIAEKKDNGGFIEQFHLMIAGRACYCDLSVF